MSGIRSVLVTGGNGFIGRHLVKRLIEIGHEVTLLQRSPECPAGTRELLKISELTSESIEGALRGRRFDWVFHLAAYGVNPQDRDIASMFRINVGATYGIVGTAASWSPSSVVIAGSGSEYWLDSADAPVSEDHPIEPFRPYGALKGAGTLCACALARALGLPFAAGRIFGVYGPGEAQHRLLPSLVRGLLLGQRVRLTTGTQQRDFLFIDDVVEAMIALAWSLESKPTQVVLNISSGRPLSVRAFAEAVAHACNKSTDLLGFGEIPLRPDEVMFFAGDSSRLQAFTGWRPRFKLESGIQRAISEIAQDVK
jgi:UDP-glucose 4-epimerase